MEKLVLFDIDGTLILSGGAGMRAMNQAFEDLFDVVDALDGISLSGRTDAMIIQDAMRKARVSDEPDMMDYFKNRYFELLPAEMDQPGTQKGVMPGINELLPELAQRPHVQLGLLTGNWETSGRIKIGYFKLNDYFPFGAFADDSSDRNALVPIAIERFNMHSGKAVTPKQVFVVGDTPKDIECTKPHGVVSVAVGAAHYDSTQLAEYDPDVLFDDLSDVDAVLSVLG